MEDASLLNNHYRQSGTIQRTDARDPNYKEPAFAKFLKSLGSFLGCACLPCCYPYKTVDKGSKGIIQEFGQFKKEVGDGIFYLNPITQTMTRVNIKVQLIDLDKQNVMTSDKLSIRIDSVVYYQIIDAKSAVFNIEDIRHSIREISHTTLRNVVGNSTLSECLEKRNDISEKIKEIIDNDVRDWGVTVISLLIKDIVVPADIISSLSSAVTAEREARAKIITAKADVEAAELMRQAADILSTPAAMQIRSLEVIDRIAANPNSKLIILPADLTLHSNMGNIVTHEMMKNN